MAFDIRLEAPKPPSEVVLRALFRKLEKSRFDSSQLQITLERPTPKYLGGIIKLQNIRLRVAKPYCGNHAGPCQARFGGEPKHVRRTYLEGLDWVSLNDLVNDVLDRLSVSAWVASPLVTVRKGRLRRTEYLGVPGGEFEQSPPRGWADYCGQQAPPSDYQDGTPGILTYRRGKHELAGHDLVH